LLTLFVFLFVPRHDLFYLVCSALLLFLFCFVSFCFVLRITFLLTFLFPGLNLLLLFSRDMLKFHFHFLTLNITLFLFHTLFPRGHLFHPHSTPTHSPNTHTLSPPLPHTQLATVRAQLQQLENTYDRTERERTEAILHARTLKEQIKLMEISVGTYSPMSHCNYLFCWKIVELF
jgi:hypothetical protein